MPGLCCTLAEIDIPFDPPLITDPFSLLTSIVEHATSRGFFYGSPKALRMRLAWDQEITTEEVSQWLADLVAWGEVTIHQAQGCYGGMDNYLQVANRTRFKRWRARIQFTDAERAEVYARDGNACRHCGSTENLSVDHIIPWSRGGEHSMNNFQTLCRSCNSRKGARIG